MYIYIYKNIIHEINLYWGGPWNICPSSMGPLATKSLRASALYPKLLTYTDSLFILNFVATKNTSSGLISPAIRAFNAICLASSIKRQKESVGKEHRKHPPLRSGGNWWQKNASPTFFHAYIVHSLMATADVMAFSFFHPGGWAWPSCRSLKPTAVLNSMG